MIFLVSNSSDPCFNLALEETLLRECGDEVFMLWQNDNTIVVGKNQNTLAEIDYDYVKENGIRVVRRITGGGAVYHDMGNVNFTYITSCDGEWESDFSRFARPVILALSELSISASVSGRNDIVADGKKISGNAQTVVNGRILHHGTILLDTNFEILTKALIPDPRKIKSKGIKSVASRVGNVSEIAGRKVSADELIRFVKSKVEELYNGQACEIPAEFIKKAEKLADEKYRTWEWNFGYSPKYTFAKSEKFDAGIVEVSFEVSDGKITAVKFSGDFFGMKDVEDIEKALCGVPHREETISDVLNKFKLSDYFGKIEPGELLKILI
ncbi:MAG: lipoate--protein ligase [Oscillospiraceae bacterium]|nr:lipoate--protein ligase [Oscillospiraceae bacterium]